ncbi:hypothetical protein KXQ82_11640 [Mucilaginibacter sp. HMF5004]|uniref:hypothetical protein n=1 Tax=Mucilaginibacter rivuli TaxID=2857527 RepID=UPI001C6064D6|nr:hypothetical protein [Mucilaginibacter rivuli]MBW4890377.1 hypothetical protein [Mucilaginibacter rivuli]
MRNKYYLFVILIPFISLSCKQKAAPEHPSFKSVFGIKFTEVKRVFDNGLSFAQNGYQMRPDWQLTFVSTDSVNIYSPGKKIFLNCPVAFDHDSVFNVAWAWIKLRKLSKDSMVFQVLHVENQVISDTKSNMFMTLYADDYIKNKLHTTAQQLQHPSRKDTLYIKKRIAEVTNITDSAFSATEQAILKSKSATLILEQVKPDVDPGSMEEPLPTYMLPEYNISISKAYDDFYYSFSVIIDAKGEMQFYRSTTVLMPEFAERTKKTIRAIIAGYLKHYLDITPGKTLGMPHASMILLNMTGKK